MSTLGPYPEELVPENFYFKCPARTKIQRLYQNILKEGNGNQKYLRFPDHQENKFEVLHTSITLDKADFECACIVKAKPTGNDSGFITY